MVVIIIAVAVSGGVLLIGGLAGYVMSSRAKLTAIIPTSSAAVVTATTTDMDLQPNYQQLRPRRNSLLRQVSKWAYPRSSQTVEAGTGAPSPSNQSLPNHLRAIPPSAMPRVSPLTRPSPHHGNGTHNRSNRSAAYEVHE